MPGTFANRVSSLPRPTFSPGLILVPRERGDLIELPRPNAYDQRVSAELRQRLGPETEVASSLNGAPGLWVSLSVGGERYWMNAHAARLHPVAGDAWWWWMLLAALLSAIGAAVIARLINRPLKQLSFAASRLRDGDFEASHLSEDDVTSEIREVNAGFNRMARQLAKIDQDRAVMLAGISHDLRTPLARLRLEAEMSVNDEAARTAIAADIEQMDAIIGQFLDYARAAGDEGIVDTDIEQLLNDVAARFARSGIRLHLDCPPLPSARLRPLAVARAVGNLIENARKYGGGEITLAAHDAAGHLVIEIMDRGPGIPVEEMERLKRPFTRLESARTDVKGTGLGLAIVERIAKLHGGTLTLAAREGGGLVAALRLPR